MTLPCALETREMDKFSEGKDGEVSVRTVALPPFISIQYTYGTVTYPNVTTEVFRFFDEEGGTLLCTVTLVYTDSSKDFLSTFKSE